MKTLIITISLLASQACYAISNCYVYSDPKDEARCERNYLGQQQDYKNQNDQFNQMVNQTTQSQATAQQADQAIQQQDTLNQLLRALNQEKGN